MLNHHFKMLMKSDLFSNEQKLQPNPLTELLNVCGISKTGKE